MSPDHSDGDQRLKYNIEKNEDSLIGLDELRQISRSLRSIFTQAGDDDGNTVLRLQHTVLRAIYTAQAGSLNPKHAIAALDALCGLLAHCSLSKHRTLLNFCCSPRVCHGTFQVFLTRLENHCSGPARRLLTIITNILLRHASTEEQEVSRRFVLEICVAALYHRKTAISIKACIQLLDHMLSKKLVNAIDIITEAGKYSSFSDTLHAPKATDSQSIAISVSRLQCISNEFTQSLLAWLRYPDCAPAIARYLPHLYQSLQNSRRVNSLDADLAKSGENVGSLWIKPLHLFLDRNPKLFETAIKHLLPGLLNLGHQNILDFSDSLPVTDILRGNAYEYPVADVELCLAAAQACPKSCHTNILEGI